LFSLNNGGKSVSATGVRTSASGDNSDDSDPEAVVYGEEGEPLVVENGGHEQNLTA
jgi:hypothetical protein